MKIKLICGVVACALCVGLMYLGLGGGMATVVSTLFYFFLTNVRWAAEKNTQGAA